MLGTSPINGPFSRQPCLITGGYRILSLQLCRYMYIYIYTYVYITSEYVDPHFSRPQESLQWLRSQSGGIQSVAQMSGRGCIVFHCKLHGEHCFVMLYYSLYGLAKLNSAFFLEFEYSFALCPYFGGISRYHATRFEENVRLPPNPVGDLEGGFRRCKHWREHWR